MRINRNDAIHYREVADRYRLATNEAQYEVATVVQWAIDHGELDVTPAAVREYYCLCMSEALRLDTARDKHGRKIRLRQCLEVQDQNENGHPVQRFLWSSVQDAPEIFLRESLRQMRDRIAEDVEALRAQQDYVNEILIQRGLPSVQLSFDFTPAPNAELSA